jgi:hypothetical protein
MIRRDLLDTFGVLAATDKACIGWDYLRHYEECFLPWRDAKFNLIEIGVGGGHSHDSERRKIMDR